MKSRIWLVGNHHAWFSREKNKIQFPVLHPVPKINAWELLIANHLDQSLWLTNQIYWVAPIYQSNLLHYFLEMENCVVPFTSHGKVHQFGAERPISYTFWLFHNKFYCLESHIEHRWRCSNPCCWFSSVVARHIIKSNNSLTLWRNFLFFKTCLLGTLVGYHKTNYKKWWSFMHNKAFAGGHRQNGVCVSTWAPFCPSPNAKILPVFGPWLILVCYKIYPLMHTLNPITTLDLATQDLTIAHLIPNGALGASAEIIYL
jgi:hypothetical protein